MARILVIDDEQAICWGLKKVGEGLGHEVCTAASAEEGLQLAKENTPDLIVLDVRLPGMDGLTALEHFRTLTSAPVIVITAFGALETAVQAVRAGALEYVVKPFALEDIRAAIERGLRSGERLSPAQGTQVPGEMVGSTPAMQELFKRIALSAASHANVLLQGESGVGKELAARAIHRYSAQAEANFVAVNVAALSPTLAESELFGHVAGSFTGASRTREGLLVQANGGTLFLDEVADIPLPLQVKLLRAIEQGEVLPVGADRPVKSRFRVIAATHRNLKSLVKSGQFRHDLYFRICAFEISIPALRERVEDIPFLANHFAALVPGRGLALAEDTLEELQRRPWFGNVRELKNAIEHAAVLARSGVVLPAHLPPAQPRFDSEDEAGTPSLVEASYARAEELLDDPAAAGTVYERLVAEVEVPLLRSAMERFDNECAPAARALGVHRTTLRKKLLLHKLSEED